MAKRLLRLLFIVFGVVAFGPLSAEIFEWWLSYSTSWFAYILPLAILTVCISVSGRADLQLRAAVGNVGSATLLILPISLLTFGNAVLLVAGIVNKELEPNSFETTLQTPKPDRRLRRVVWIIFDELDFSAISNRPPGIHLSTFDDLMRTSFVAENAFPPHYWTSVSIPALLTGKKVYWVLPHGPREITLNFADESFVELAETDTVFSDVVSRDGTAAAAGWYHPYPRLFQTQLAAAYWTPPSTYRCRDWLECSNFAVVNAIKDVPLLGFVPIETLISKSERPASSQNRLVLSYREHVESNTVLLDHARKLVSKENIDLVFLHFPIPHAPYLGRSNEPGKSYFEALEAADETVTILRNEMIRANLWDQTTLIVSSDHWMRSDLHSGSGQSPRETFVSNKTRIPFIVRLPEGGQPMRYSRFFNTVITRDLINSIITGDVSTSAEISVWLDRFAKDREDLMTFHPCRGIENLNILAQMGSERTSLTCN